MRQKENMNNEWVMVKLEDVCTKASSNISLNKVTDNTGDYALFGASGFAKNIVFYHQDKEYIAIVKDGAGVGRVMMLPAKSSIVGTMQYILPKNNIDICYLSYFLKQIDLAKYASGATIPHIYFKDYSKERIFLPSIKKQREIAAVLDKASELVEKRKTQLAELNALAESIFYDMFGDPVTNEKEWDMKKLNLLGKITTGNTPSRQVDSYYNEEYIEWIKTDNITDGVIHPTTAREYISKEGLNVGRKVNENSLLITCIAGSIKSIGTVCLTDRRVAFNQQINAFSPNTDICNHLFMWCLIRFSKQYIQDNATKGMKRIITKSVIEKLLFINPPLKLQQQFAQRIEKIEEQKQKVKAALKESEDLFQRLMQDMFNPEYHSS